MSEQLSGIGYFENKQSPEKKVLDEERITKLCGTIRQDNEDLWSAVYDKETGNVDLKKYLEQASEMVEFESEEYENPLEQRIIRSFWNTGLVMHDSATQFSLADRHMVLKEKKRSAGLSPEEEEEYKSIPEKTEKYCEDIDKWENDTIWTIIALRKHPQLRAFVNYFWTNFDKLGDSQGDLLKNEGRKIKSGIINTMASIAAFQRLRFKVRLATAEQNYKEKIDYSVYREKNGLDGVRIRR